MPFRIPFSGRGHNYLDSEIAHAVHTMRTAIPLTQGPHLDRFETKFREYIGADHAFAVSNATNGLELAAQLCQLESRDEVIIPAHTFTSSAYPFLKAGAKIIWADIDPVTHVISAQSISSCVTPNTRVLVVPHLYGFGADMPAIMKIAGEHDLIVVEDVAQALGVIIDGKMAGTFGDIGVYSFHSHKNITTLGEGGMLTVRDAKWADVIPMLRHNGHCAYPYERPDYWIPAMGDVDLPTLDGKPLWPMNCCLGEVECALGAKLLNRIDDINLEKRERAIQMIDFLSDYSELVFHREASARHNYHLLVAQVQYGYRDRFIRRMACHHGIQCVVQYYPLNRYPFYSKLGYGAADIPHTDLFFDNMVSFPFNHLLSNTDLDEIVATTQETLSFIRNQ